MSEENPEVQLVRTGAHEFLGRNSQGATVRLGLPGVEGAFTPGELLQVALAGCMSLTTEDFVMRRAGQNAAFTATAGSRREVGVREYQGIRVDMQIDLSFLDAVTRDRVTASMRSAVERQCTVHRTLERGAEVTLSVDTAGATIPAQPTD